MGVVQGVFSGRDISWVEMTHCVWTKSKYFRTSCLHYFWKSKIVDLKKRKEKRKKIHEGFFLWMEHSILVQFIAFSPHLVPVTVFTRCPLLSVVMSLHAHACPPVTQGLFWWNMSAMVRVRWNRHSVFTSKFKMFFRPYWRLVFFFKILLRGKTLTPFEDLYVGNNLHNVSSLLAGQSRHSTPHKVLWLRPPHCCFLLEGLCTGKDVGGLYRWMKNGNLMITSI